MTYELFKRGEIHVGREAGAYEWEITPALVRAYIDATGDDNLWYTEGSPLGGPIAPALILHSAPFRNLDWYLPNLYGNLHAREECDFFAPVTVGEKLSSSALIVDRYHKRDRQYVVNETLITNARRQIVARLKVHQSFLTDGAASSGFAIDKSRERAQGRDFKTGERQGEKIAAPARRITESMCMAFSGPARNYHTDRDKALELGFPDIVVQGMLSVCLIAEMMTRRFGLGFFHGGRLDVKLVNVLWCGEQEQPQGIIVERRPEGDRIRAAAEVWCAKSDSVKTIVGAASAIEL